MNFDVVVTKMCVFCKYLVVDELILLLGSCRLWTYGVFSSILLTVNKNLIFDKFNYCGIFFMWVCSMVNYEEFVVL